MVDEEMSFAWARMPPLLLKQMEVKTATKRKIISEDDDDDNFVVVVE